MQLLMIVHLYHKQPNHYGNQDHDHNHHDPSEYDYINRCVITDNIHIVGIEFVL